MEIQQISDNKLKISLDNVDFKRYNLTLDSFMSIKIYKNPIILDILQFIYKMHFIQLKKSNILFDTFLLNNTIVLFITRVRFLLQK